MNKFKIFLSVVFLIIFYVDLSGQTVLSPYSNYGLGNMMNTRNAVIKALGKSSTAYRDFTVINYDNPASYTAFDTTSFVLDASLDIRSLSLNTSADQASNTYSSLGNIQFGFPISKKMKASIGLFPLSNVGYNISTYATNDTTGRKKYNYFAEGGVNNVYLGLGWGIGNFSIGANVSYLFGTIDKNQALLYPDSSYFFNIKILNETYINSFYGNLGIQYNKKIGKDYFVCIGASYSPQINLKTKESIASYSYTVSSDVETIKDTIKLYENKGYHITMPQKISFGIMVKQLNRYKIITDFTWQDWSKYKSFTTNEKQLHDSYAISAGFEYTPRAATIANYLKWIKYRIGVYYEKTPLIINNSQIHQFGATIGMGFPIIRSASTINLTLDVGNRGTKSNNLIQETYLNFTVGFSLYDTWFYRIKYK